MKSFYCLTVVAVVMLFTVGTVLGIPQLINYQGYLADDLGNPVADGHYALVFRIWDAETGPNQLWSEDHDSVYVANGLFNVILGGRSPLTLPFDTDYWLGVEVEGGSELPRMQLTSVCYSYRAGMADSALAAVHSAYADSAGVAGPVGYADSARISFQSLYADSSAYAARSDTASHALSAPATPDDDWVVSGEDIYRLDGMVGIGTDNPTERLQVVNVDGAGATTISARATTGSSVGSIALGATSVGGNVIVIATTDDAAEQWAFANWAHLQTFSGANDQAFGLYVSDFAGLSTGGQQHGLYVDLDDPDVNSYSIYVAPGSGVSYFGSNVGIGTTIPQGALDVNSTTGAFIAPRMTTTQRDALTAVNGMIIYNTSTNQFNFYENGAWVAK